MQTTTTPINAAESSGPKDFKRARDELQAAQILLADRVAEVADGLVHQGRGTFEDAATRWLKGKVRIRPSTRRSYEHLLVCYLIPYFGDRKLRLIQVIDIERYRAELSQGIPDSIRQATDLGPVGSQATCIASTTSTWHDPRPTAS